MTKKATSSIFDGDTETAGKIVLDETVIRMTTDPELMGALTSKTMLSNTLNRRPAIIMLILVRSCISVSWNYNRSGNGRVITWLKHRLRFKQHPCRHPEEKSRKMQHA